MQTSYTMIVLVIDRDNPIARTEKSIRFETKIPPVGGSASINP